MATTAHDALQVITRPSKIRSMIVAKSGVLVNGTQLRNAFIGGFAIARNAGTASAAAKFEVLERLHALFDVARSHVTDAGTCRSVRWPDLEAAPPLPASMCLLGPHPFGPAPYLDATGLAFHTDLRRCVQHGFYEALERHFTARIWYRGECMAEVGAPQYLIDDFVCRTFTLAKKPALPFAIAVICNEARSFACAGASFRENLGAAIDHAVDEACLLLDGYLECDAGPTCSDLGRLLSLRDPEISKMRLRHFEGLVTERREGHTKAANSWNLLDDISEHLGGVPQARAGLLCSGPQGFVARTVVTGLDGLQASRRDASPTVPSDWFC